MYSKITTYLYSTVLLLLLHTIVFAQDTNRSKSAPGFEDLDSLIKASFEIGQYQKSVYWAQKARKKAEDIYGRQDSIYQSYANWCSQNYGFMAKNDSGRIYADQVLQLQKESKVKNPYIYATTLHNLGIICYQSGQYQASIDNTLKAIEIRGKIYGKEHELYASSLNNVSVFYRSFGQLRKALETAIECNEISKKVYGTEHSEYLLGLQNLSTIYQDLGQHEDALSVAVECKNKQAAIMQAHNPHYLSTLSIESTNLIYLQRFEEAHLILQDILATVRKHESEKSLNYAKHLCKLGDFYIKTQDYKKSLESYQEAKAIYLSKLGKKHPNYFRTIDRIAHIYNQLYKHKEALALNLEYTKGIAQIYGKHSPAHAVSLNNLGNTYKLLQNYDLALQSYKKAKTILEVKFPANHHNVITTNNNIVNAYIALEQYDIARSIVLLTIERTSKGVLIAPLQQQWTSKILQLDQPSNATLKHLINSFRFLYQIEHKQSTENKALVIELVTSLLKQIRNKVTTEKDKLRLLSLSNNWMQKGLNTFAQDNKIAEAFLLSEQNKSILLLEALQSNDKGIRLLPDSLKTLSNRIQQEQQQQRARIQESRSHTEKDSLTKLLVQANADWDRFRTMLQKDYPQYYKLKQELSYASVKKIQQQLASGQALVEYVISDKILHLFYIDAQQIEWKQLPLKAKELEQKIEHYHKTLSAFNLLSNSPQKLYTQYSTEAYWFYQQLIAPALSNRKEINRLIIIPDQKIAYLPFESFLSKEAPKDYTPYQELDYLLKSYTISYNYSATLWIENQQKKSLNNNGTLLAVAPSYNSSISNERVVRRSARDAQLRSQLSPLPGARVEVQYLKDNFKGTFLFDKEATERKVKQLASNYSVLHFASHGLLNAQKPLLSSIALTEDNDSVESNFLQAYEISQMNLHAELAVLSACETGIGKAEKGNGLASLSRSFMYAGVPALIVSLWPVNDDATYIIMQQFYENLAEGLDKAAALRQAKLHYIENNKGAIAYPGLWTPFIHVGNSHPIQLKKASSSLLIWGIASIVILLFLVLMMKYRKQ